VNALDRLIAAVAPTAALRRELARTRLAELSRVRDRVRRYEGADRGRRTQGWVTQDSSPTAATRGALHDLRARCRDLRRNNPWASSAVRELAANVAGIGVRPRFTHERDEELRRATELWEEWASTTQADASGRETFFTMQAAAFEGLVDGGETLVRRRLRRAEDALSVPLQVQLLEGDHLDTLRDLEGEAGTRLVQGVAFDLVGRRVGYWLFPEHPGDLYSSATFLSSRFVPASEIRHLYRADRVGQVRGVPWGAVVALRLHDFDAYEDNEQLRMVVATSSAGFVHDLSGADASFSDGVGLGQKTELAQPVDELHSGTVEYLAPGKTITFPTPPQNEGFGAFSTVQLRAVAKGYGVPPWLLSGDLSGVNFSSIRADWIGFNRNVEVWRARILLPHLCEPVMRWWREAAEVADLLTPGLPDPDRLRWEWIPPRREMLDPRTEVMAEVESVRAGFKSLSQVVSGLGTDPERVLAALADDLARARELGLKLSVDGENAGPGRIGTVNGNGQKPGQNGTPAEDDEEDAEEEDRMARDLLRQLRRRGYSLADAVGTIVGT
jgi:lambda family phage portal protein